MNNFYALLIYVFASGAQYQIPVGSHTDCLKLDMEITYWQLQSLNTVGRFYSTCKRIDRKIKT